MDIFELTEEAPEELPKYEIEGERRHYLPGTHCPVCDQYRAEVGVGYPTVDVSAARQVIRRLVADNIELSEYEELRAALVEHVPPELPLMPGVGFGSFKGKHGGVALDFMWWVGELFVSRHAANSLQTSKARFRSAEAHFQTRGGKTLDVVEIEAWPVARLHPSCAPAGTLPPCPKCGRWVVKTTTPILVADTIPAQDDVFRALGATSRIFVTSRFADALTSHGLRGCSLRPVEVR
jgi:uncharacterized double-CXXCG motif protein